MCVELASFYFNGVKVGNFHFFPFSYFAILRDNF